MAKLPYRAELDGLRALSVLAVIVYHVPAGREVLRAGFIGVDLFFALSGALITQLGKTGGLSPRPVSYFAVRAAV